MWGVGRHGPGNNVFTDSVEPNGFVTEYTTEVDQVVILRRARCAAVDRNQALPLLLEDGSAVDLRAQGDERRAGRPHDFDAETAQGRGETFLRSANAPVLFRM